jgi:hypothetical protein
MVVHYVEVNQVGARGNDGLHFFTESGEIGGKNARGDSIHGRPNW